MNLPLAFAGILTIVLGLVHSVGGEWKVFPRIETLSDPAGKPLISDWNLRVLRGTWHTLSLFGFGLGLLLFTLAFPSLGNRVGETGVIAVSLIVIAAYWAYATRFWHPAWIVFIVLAALCWFA
jgi:hypothetical protein